MDFIRDSIRSLFICVLAAGVFGASASGAPAPRQPKSQLTGSLKKTALAPTALIANRAQRILADLKRRPLRPLNMNRETEASSGASKVAWLQTIYDRGLVESSWATEMMADKRLLGEVLERELGAKARHFYPKTLGLREFLVKRKLINASGEIVTGGDEIEEALIEEFPMGFVARPAVGIAPQETSRGLFADSDHFIVEILKPENIMYAPSHLHSPVKSHILGAVASGEAVVLQENIVGAAEMRRPLKAKYFQKVRIHTYEGRVVEGAVPERWVQASLLTTSEIQRAEAFVGEFLVNLSLHVLARQAWGVDVAIMDNGEMRIIDVVTNRGKPIAWSSYLDQPRVIAAYAKHFEDQVGLHLTGFSGLLIRNGFGNYFPFWEMRIEKSRPGLGKVLAFLPPIP